MGRHQIWAGNTYSAYTEEPGEVSLAADNFFDTGFQTLNSGVKGQYVYSRRKGRDSANHSEILLYEIRLYQCLNLLEHVTNSSSQPVATITSDTTDASEADFPASNLLTNFGARNLNSSNFGRLNWDGSSRVGEKSCYVTTEA